MPYNNFGSSIFFASCTESPIKNDNYVTIRLKPIDEKQPISKFIDEVEYIKLQTPINMVIGSVEKVIVYNSDYYVCHTPTNARISVFDSEGVYKYNIGNQGRGPGEYVGLHDFTINSEQDEVIITDLMQQKMHYYRIDGNYKKSNDLPIHALKFSYLVNDGYIFWVGNLYNEIMNKGESQLWNVYVVDQDLKIKSKHLEVPKEFMGAMNGSLPSSLSPYKEGVNIVAPLSNYIYHYQNGIFKTKYYLDFGSLNCDFIEEFQKYYGMTSSFVFNLRKTGATYYPSQFFEFQNYLYFTFISNDEMYSVFYDKKSETAHVGFEYPIDDINDAIFGKAVGSNSNGLITSIEPLHIVDEEEKFPQSLDYLQLEPNSNPFLAVYKMR